MQCTLFLTGLSRFQKHQIEEEFRMKKSKTEELDTFKAVPNAPGATVERDEKTKTMNSKRL